MNIYKILAWTTLVLLILGILLFLTTWAYNAGQATQGMADTTFIEKYCTCDMFK